MELSRFSDYSLRVLMYAAAQGEGKVTLSELASVYRISQHHLVKVVRHLGKLGYLENKRGRGGGIRLGRAAEEILVGEVIRQTETHFDLTECFDARNVGCRLSPACRLKGVLQEACEAFLGVLDVYTLGDLVRGNQGMLRTMSRQHRRGGMPSRVVDGLEVRGLWSLPLRKGY